MLHFDIPLKFNRLTIVERLPDRNHKTKVVKCLCDCGNYTIVQYSNLINGHTKSCGCLNAETLANFKHGMCKSPEYKSYRKMIERCYYKKQSSYSYYGGRGIKVCERWLMSFDNFFKDMGLKPSNNHSLDRLDVNGNYEPSNCRWATKKEQSNNTRRNVIYEYNGKSMTQSQWAEHLGISHEKISRHISENNVGIGEIVEYVRLNGSKSRIRLNKKQA